MAENRAFLLVAECLALASQHRRDVTAMPGDQIVARNGAIQLVDGIDQIVFTQELVAIAVERGLQALDNGPAQPFGTLLELVALDERLARRQQLTPVTGERPRKGDRNHAVVIDTE